MGLKIYCLSFGIVFLLSVNNVFEISLTLVILVKSLVKRFKDVPVEILYNTKDLHLTKAPETVNVTISGPQSKDNKN